MKRKYTLLTLGLCALLSCTLTAGCTKKTEDNTKDITATSNSPKTAAPKETSTTDSGNHSANDNAQNADTTDTNPDSVASPTSSPLAITISAAGDCTFGSDKGSPSSVNFYAVYNKKKNDSYFFKNVQKYFAKDDLTLVNFEGTLTDSNARVDKTYAFKGSPSYTNILTQGSVEAVSFANNHCRDYGEQSYTDTIKAFKNADISYASYSKVAIYKTKGKKIGMVAVNGLLNLDYCKDLVTSGIKKLKKKKADIIIVSMHAGIEHTSTLNTVQTELGHFAVKKGANLVLGHHPHTLQGIEKYKGAYIVYSLANFCFGGNTNPTDKDTMIFQQTFTFNNDTLAKSDDVRIIPCSISSVDYINNYQPTPLKGSKRQAVIQKINEFSKSLGKVSFDKKGAIQK